MRYLVLLAALLGFAMSCAAAGAPAGVDGLTPEEVAKAVTALKENFARPEALSDAEMARATLQGLLDRLAPEVSLVSGTGGGEEASPFYSELYEGKTGYLRLGELSPANLQMAAQALKEWSGKGVGAVVLDLRGTPPSSDFDAGARLAENFCAKGTEMFSLTSNGRQQKAGLAPGETRIFAAAGGPVFTGILVVLVDGDAAEAPEAVAASLKECAKALVVGDKTAGRAFQYRDFPLDGAVLRVAAAQVILPDGKEPGENGLKPDIDVSLGTAGKAAIMRSISAKGVESVVAEHGRPHLNEAALVSGSNPELDELEAEQAGRQPVAGLIDRQLQRALDLVTSISIYQAKEGR